MSGRACLRLTVASRLEQLGGVRSSAREFAVEHGFPPALADDLALCVHEAVSNAIVHGNQEDEQLQVEVSLTSHGGALRVTVRNEGPGFDSEAVMQALRDDGEQPRGRGMRIIASLSNDVTWSDHGRELTFVARR